MEDSNESSQKTSDNSTSRPSYEDSYAIYNMQIRKENLHKFDRCRQIGACKEYSIIHPRLFIRVLWGHARTR